MKAIYSLLTDPDQAQRTVNTLRSIGITDDQIAIMSSEPLEEHEFAQRDRKTFVSLIAVLAGVAGCVAGVALTSLTQLAWPLNTGGMPIVSIWPNLIIIFEMTMLSAILATVVTLFVATRLPKQLPEFYDPEISKGKILIGVANPPESSIEELEKALAAG